MRAGLEEFKLPSHRGFLCFREDRSDLLAVHGSEALHCLERLVQDRRRVDPGDDHRRRRIQSEVQGLHGSHCLAFEDEVISKGLHGKYGSAMLLRHRRNPIQKRSEMRVHHVDRHLHGVEMKSVLVGSLKHSQVHAWILVTREANVADFARLLCFLNSFYGPALCENKIRSVQANYLMELQEIDRVRLQASQRLFNL